MTKAAYSLVQCSAEVTMYYSKLFIGAITCKDKVFYCEALVIAEIL